MLKGEVEVETTAVAGGAGKMANKSEGFEGGGNAGDGQRISLGVVGTACVDVEKAVVCLGTEADTIEASALLN